MIEKITIGITCFKEGELLIRAWQSILDQTNIQWQAVIIIDGGADQKTVDIFNSIEHPRLLKYQFTKNVEDLQIVGGNPAKFIRMRKNELEYKLNYAPLME